MTGYKGHLVDYIASGSPAEKAGIKTGWRLLKIDNQDIGDIIDYRIIESDTSLRLLMMTEEGYLRRIKIHKPASAPLGMRFDPPTISSLQHCQNRCIFCFVEQNPSGLRKALYVKDDDYRLSFLYGNFITLNRMTDEEIERVKRLQLSPLYVSVHTTNPDLREVMFNSKRAGRGLENLKKLAAAGIGIHAQIVLCPGYNTGEEMKRTIRDLDGLGKGILSIALVPVGLTRYRHGLAQLKRFNTASAEKLIKQISALQKYFLEKRGSRFVFLADEFYNLAHLPLPEDYEYEGYPQLENGVGLARQFLEQLKEVTGSGITQLSRPLSVTIVSGLAAKPQLLKMNDVFKRIGNLTIKTVFAKNLFFGEQVTVSGLLTGSDLLSTLEGKEAGDVVIVPDILLKENSTMFIDDLKLCDLEKSLQVPVRKVSGPRELLDLIVEMAGGRKNQLKRRAGS